MRGSEKSGYILSALTAAALFAALPMPCAAAETFSYTVLDNGTASLKCEDAGLVHAEIPETIDGYTVTELSANCFDGCTEMETVSIPDSVTAIRSYAFQNCSMLQTVTIPDSVTVIEDFVFEGCLSLAEIQVEDGNETYYDEDGILFKDGISKTLVRYPAAKKDTSYQTPETCGTVSPWAFTGCRYLQILDFTQTSAIGADVCMNCEKLRKVTVCNDVSELIGAGFAYCTSLKSIQLPERLRSIGDRCFFGDTDLESADFPEGLNSVGDQAFFACINLKDLYLPKSLKNIGEESFGYSVNNEGKSTKIPDVAFHVQFGSEGYQYAKKNGFAYKSEVPQSLILLLIVGILLVVLMGFGLSIELKRRKAAKKAEEERLELERRRKAHEERMQKKKGKKQEKSTEEASKEE